MKPAPIVMAVFNMSYTITVGFLASVCGLIRMLKTHSSIKNIYKKHYSTLIGKISCISEWDVLATPISILCSVILYFFYGLAEFYNQMFPATVQDLPRSEDTWIQLGTIDGTSCKTIKVIDNILHILAIDNSNRFGKNLEMLLIGQYNMLKFRVTP